MSKSSAIMAGVALALLAAACGSESSTTAGPSQSASLVDWCAAQTVDFCRWGLENVGFERTPDRLECLIASSSVDEFINSECNRTPEVPQTTIPDPTAPEPQADLAELDAVEQWIRRVLLEAHPDDQLEAGVVLSEAAVLDDALALVTSLNAEPFAVWRRDWVCFDPYGANGLTGWPRHAARLAYLHGEGEAERLRSAAGASGEPIVGHDFFEAQLTLIVLASEAVDDAVVTIEAVLARIRVRDLDTTEGIPGVAAVRILNGYDRGIWPGDLTAADAPDCG